jgi:hypothetical protein
MGNNIRFHYLYRDSGKLYRLAIEFSLKFVSVFICWIGYAVYESISTIDVKKKARINDQIKIPAIK